MKKCWNHPDRVATNVCKACWNSFCEDCYSLPVEICNDCAELERIKNEVSLNSKSKWKIPKVIYMLIATFIAVILFYFLIKPLSEVPIKKLVRTLPKERPSENITAKSENISVIADTKSTALKILDKAKFYRKNLPNQMGINNYIYDENLLIKVYSSQKEFSKDTGNPLWADGSSDSSKGRINIVADFENNSVLVHEMSHMIFDNYLGYENSYTLWMDEGIAVLQQMKEDGLLKQNMRENLEEIKAGNYTPIKSLSDVKISEKSNRQEIDIWYSQCASIVFYLQKAYGMNKFSNFLKEMRNDKSFEENLVSTYGLNVKQLEKKWFQDIRTSKSYF